MQLLLPYYYHEEKLHLKEFNKLLEKPISKIVIYRICLMKKISQNAWIKMDGHRLRWKTWLFSCNFACNVQYIVWVYVIVVLIVNDCEGLGNKFSYCSVIRVLSFKDACWMTITCQCWENKLWYTVNKVKLAIFTLYHKNLWQNKFTLCLVFEFWILKEYSYISLSGKKEKWNSFYFNR